MFALVFMKTWKLLFHAWDGKEGAVGVVTIHCSIRPDCCFNLAIRMSPLFVLETFSLLTRVDLMKAPKASASGTARCVWARHRWAI